MNDLRRISATAIVLLVALRVCIGWQMLYEGLWKWDTRDEPTPWTSRGFLLNARGPMRGFFRETMAGDPADEAWLGYEMVGKQKVPFVQTRWGDWLQTWGNHYELDDAEFGRLSRVVRGPEWVTSDAFDLPEGIDPTSAVKAVEYDAEARKLKLRTAAFDSEGYWNPKYHIVPQDRAKLLKLVPDVTEKTNDKDVPLGEFDGPDPDRVKFAEQVQLLYDRQAKLSYFERVRAMILGDPELVTIVNESEDYAESADAKRMGKIEQYQTRLAAHEAALSSANVRFQQAHLDHEWGELQTMRNELIGPIRQLEKEMKAEAARMLTDEQRAMGPPPEPWTRQDVSDWTAIWSLTLFGLLLMLGLGTRVVAVLAGGMLLTFYMVWPPFPGVPEAPGPEHALWVNKNFIEALALFALAALPTGTWFGLDGVCAQCCSRCRGGKGKAAETSVATVGAAAASGEGASGEGDAPTDTSALSGDATPEAIANLSAAAQPTETPAKPETPPEGSEPAEADDLDLSKPSEEKKE